MTTISSSVAAICCIAIEELKLSQTKPDEVMSKYKVSPSVLTPHRRSLFPVTETDLNVAFVVLGVIPFTVSVPLPLSNFISPLGVTYATTSSPPLTVTIVNRLEAKIEKYDSILSQRAFDLKLTRVSLLVALRRP